MRTPPAVEELGDVLRPLGWVTDLFVAGSAATGDHRDGVSDLDLDVRAHGDLVERPLSGIVRAELVRHGFAVLGRPPQEVQPRTSDDEDLILTAPEGVEIHVPQVSLVLQLEE